ncbi:MAG: hypothetical protein EKK48_12250 [Candidatus Melainabacteria bacterium]|nr:MAG: hypothetical protein EKK48_12250 [Candidatus Melainabacteria bacterium]
MARTDIPVTTVASINQQAANSFDVAGTAADTSNGNSFTVTGREMLLVENTDDDTAYTFTVASAPDRLLRTADIVNYSLNFGEKALLGPFPMEGWNNSGKVNLNASNAAIKFLPFRIPNTL